MPSSLGASLRFFAEGRRFGDCTSIFERFICRTAGPNPRGISRDARSPAHRAAGPVPVRSRFRDMGRSPCRASGREVPNPHRQRPVCDGSSAGRATGWTSGSASTGHRQPTPLHGSLETARIVAVSPPGGAGQSGGAGRARMNPTNVAPVTRGVGPAARSRDRSR
jgi:hypothetical protein